MRPAEHFTTAPEWRWFILAYFVLAGLSAGSFILATLLRFSNDPRDEHASRLGFLLALPPLVLCPILLIIDLGQPIRFWHMVVDTGGGAGLAFKPWSPMSLGVWGLLLYSFFALVAFVHALAQDGRFRNSLTRPLMRAHTTPLGLAFDIAGSVFAVFIATYTGVLLSVSNQPVWSDTWVLGALFLVSGLGGAAALMSLAASRWRRSAAVSEERLGAAERYFALLEMILIVVFFTWLAVAGQLEQAVGVPWFILWIIALAGLAVPLGARLATRLSAGPGGTAHLARSAASPAVVAAAALIGVIALRAAVIWSAQS